MSFLQTEFEKFHKNIRLHDIEDNAVLREKRDMLVRELKEWCKKNEKPSFVYFNQGSYTMNTGVVPLASDDYDIDVGLIFDIDIEDYPDPIVVKKWVVEALSNKPNRTVEMKTPCVRVQYHKAGEVSYHVDFAIYGKEYSGELVTNLKIAKGREHSNEENKVWEVSQPKKLKDLIQDKYDKKEERWQFKRNIRYLKRWKDHNFTNGKPTGIAMTSMAYDWFMPEVTYNWNNEVKEKSDLYALKNLVEDICNNSFGLYTTLPVLPHNDLFYSIKSNKAHKERYIKKIEELRDVLREVVKEVDPHEAAKMLRKVFGDDFPVPDKDKTAKIIGVPAITTSSESA